MRRGYLVLFGVGVPLLVVNNILLAIDFLQFVGKNLSVGIRAARQNAVIEVLTDSRVSSQLIQIFIVFAAASLLMSAIQPTPQLRR
jgi:hypothetical protein